MAWTIKYSRSAAKELKSLDRQIATRIHSYMTEKIAICTNPRDFGKALQGDLSEYWRYRIGDFRVLCTIQDDVVTILVVRVGHRREVYSR